MAKPPSQGIQRLHARTGLKPSKTETESKIALSLLLSIQLLSSPGDNALSRFLIAQNLLSPGFHYRVGTQHTFYADTPEDTAQKMGITIRRRMHGEDGMVVEGFKSLVDTTSIQVRDERENPRPDIYKQARDYVNEKGEEQLLNIFNQTIKILLPSSQQSPLLSEKNDRIQQAWDLLQMFDTTLPDQNRPQSFSDPFLKLYEENTLAVKKALTRVLMGVLPFQSEKLEYYASGLTQRKRKELKQSLPLLQFFGKDQVVRCFYHLLYHSREYEMATDCGVSGHFTKPQPKLRVSEAEIEEKLHHNQTASDRPSLEYLESTIGAHLVKLELDLGTRKFGDKTIYPSPSKGMVNFYARSPTAIMPSQIRDLILEPEQAKMIAQLSRQYGI